MSQKKKTPLSCDWENPISRSRTNKKTHKKNKIKLYRFKGDFLWQGVKVEEYKPAPDNWSGVIRQTLIGNRRETTKFHLRYFEIAPGGYTSFEIHKHEHVVICVRGKGICFAGKKKHSISLLDIIYIEPNAPHQLKNPFRKPFGFFCIVNARRDKPKILL